MLSQYLKLAFRQLRRRPGYTAIHLIGLATGLAACLLLVQYVGFELSFDRFHSKADNLYRVVNARYQDGDLVQEGTITYSPVGKLMEADFPEIVNSARVFFGGNTIVTTEDEIYRIERGYYVSASFLDMFDFNLIAAKADSLFQAPQQMIITKQQADTWFPGLNGRYNTLLGRGILIDQEENPYEIVGVMEEIPANTHFQFDCLLSFKSIIRYFGDNADNSMTWSDFYHYVELNPKADVMALQSKFADFSERHFRGAEVSGSVEQFYLQPLADAHLKSTTLEYELGKTANGTVIWALLLIAFLILVIAWINYANLTVSRSLERAQEVGVRKVVGAGKRQLVGQFLTEALLANVISLVLALVIVRFSQGALQNLFGFDLGQVSTLSTLQQQPVLWLGGLGLFLFGLGLSALYPAWVLSSSEMVTAIKGAFSQKRSARGLRNGLVVFQFATSIALIAGTLLVYQQVNYLQQQDLGVNLEQIMVMGAPEQSNWDSTFIDRMDVFKQALADIPGVNSACTSSRMPGQGTGRIFQAVVPSLGENINHTINFIQVDHNYAETFDLNLVAGRDFVREDHSPDWAALNTILINETAVQHLGFSSPEAAIGQIVETYDKPWTVVGVFTDFHQQSLHHPIEPLLLQPAYGTYNPIAMRVSTNNLPETLQNIRTTFDSYFPSNAFHYHFLDERFAMQYAADRQFASILSGFTFLTILIACLGLIGLAAYTIQLRLKEVSIRKILGAARWNILYLLSKDFMVLIIVAIVIGLPLAWWGVQQWLTNYAFQAPVAWRIYPLAAFAGLAVAMLTVGYFAWQATRLNPVKYLRRD